MIRRTTQAGGEFEFERYKYSEATYSIGLSLSLYCYPSWLWWIDSWVE